VGLLLAGCGGDDNSDNNSGQPFAPITQAAVTDPNAIYTVHVAGQGTVTLRFPANGRYQTVLDGQMFNGTISNLQRTGDAWTATLTPDPNQQGAEAGAMTLTWTGLNAGTFTFLPQGGPVQNGTFTVTQGSPGPGGGGTNAGSSGGTNNPPGGGTGGASIVGKTLQLSYQGGGGEKFVFTSPTAASYENGADTATYQYDSATGVLTITRTGGQTYRLILAPGSSSGTATVNYQEPGGTPSSSAATYTLQ